MSSPVRSSASARCFPLSLFPCPGAVRGLAFLTLFFRPVLDAQEPAPTPTVDVDPGVSDTPDVKPPEGDNPIWRAGLLVEAALTLPAGKPYDFMLLGQSRWLADTGVVVPETEWPPKSAPVRLSHAFVAIGIGFRL